MEKYVDQLIEDFQVSKKNVPDSEEWLQTYNQVHSTDYNAISGCEIFEKEESLVHVEDLLGIESYCFPPSNDLTEAQLQKLSAAMIDLLNSWKIEVYFPEATPFNLRYNLLLELWNEEISYVPIGVIGMDFCSNDCGNCRLSKYCNRREYCDYE